MRMSSPERVLRVMTLIQIGTLATESGRNVRRTHLGQTGVAVEVDLLEVGGAPLQRVQSHISLIFRQSYDTSHCWRPSPHQVTSNILQQLFS